MKNLISGAALLVAGILTNTANAAVPAIPCNNCSDAQEEQTALSAPGLGIRFIYDLQGNSIRKFKVYLDSPMNVVVLDAIPVEPQPKEDARVSTPSGVTVRTLWEMSVDPDMVAVFAEMRQLYQQYPNAFSKQFRVDITNLGLTYGDIAPRYYDPQRIGWDHPGGESRRFMDSVTNLVGSSSSAGSVDARLSRLIHKILKPAQAAYIEGGTGGVTGGVQLSSVGSEFTVDFCNSDGACTRVKITITTNGVRSEYVESRDKWDVIYPSISETVIRRQWGRNGFEYARDMAAFVSNRTGGDYHIEGGGPICTRVLLACSDAGAQMLCTVYCQR